MDEEKVREKMEKDKPYRIHWSYPDGDLKYIEAFLDSHHPEDADMILLVPIVLDYNHIGGIEEIENFHGQPSLTDVSREALDDD